MSGSVTRVLIVEDESIVALDLQSLLKRLGFEVCGRETTGEGALKRARQEEPDLILMDIRLGGEMDGISSAAAIREELDVPVIFLTAYADRETVERAKASDAYGYLLKPFQEREIEIAIDMAIYKHETQKRLQRQQALLDTTLESIPDAVLTLDEDERVVLVNEEVLRLLGKREEELLGERFDDVVSLEEVEGGKTRKSAGGSWVRLPGGPLLEMRRRYLEEPGGGSGTVVILRDISLQAAYEEQMESARRAAEEASTAKSEFIANMSHELRTPMNSILGMSELAMEMASQKEQQEYLSILRRSAEELQGLISNVLDFSRIESGNRSRENIPFRLDELLEELAQRQMARAQRKGLYLVCTIDPHTPLELLGERESIASILMNLISNALKFTRKGGVTVSASLAEEGSSTAGGAGGWVPLLLEVRDTGIGIPEEARSRVFEPFTQVDPSATRDYGGTGLGLALVRRLTEELQGEIAITSDPGEGTTVRLRLHLERNTGVSRSLSTGIENPPELPRRGNEGDGRAGAAVLSVLVVDDQAISRVATENMLRSKGYEVRSVPGGVEALEELRSEMADVVLLDLEMPELDGWETTARIREEVPRGSECAIIAMTGHSSDAERERARILDMDEFVSKPVSNEALDSVIRSTFARKRYTRRLKQTQQSPGKGEESAQGLSDGRETESPEDDALLQRARVALENGECEMAETLLVEYRARCSDRKDKDSVFMAILACRREESQGALLRLDGIGSGG